MLQNKRALYDWEYCVIVLLLTKINILFVGIIENFVPESTEPEMVSSKRLAGTHVSEWSFLIISLWH